ncbi:MAG TPA: YdeI/OmpD-associated family protein [Candidatus Acidoferrum sp.]|nr:YdeI/OmpD-associated family protein [Candidatus Acidoferrum sp.]
MNSGIQVFAASIYKVGVIRYVDVPREASKKFGGGPHVPVAGTVEGVPVRTTLVSRGKGCYRMAIHGTIRKKLRADSGAVVEIAIELDEDSREPELPPALVLALRHAPKAQKRFRAVSTALRRQIVRYLVAVKSQATLERRVSKFVARWERMDHFQKPKAGKRKKNGK